MSFRELSARVLEPACQWLMILGIVALCQPWVEVLHRYGVTITLVGLIGFAFLQGFRITPDRNNSDNEYPGGPAGDGHGL